MVEALSSFGTENDGDLTRALNVRFPLMPLDSGPSAPHPFDDAFTELAMCQERTGSDRPQLRSFAYHFLMPKSCHFQVPYSMAAVALA